MLANVNRRLYLMLTNIYRRLFDVYRLLRTEIYILFEWNHLIMNGISRKLYYVDVFIFLM